ncbi:integrase core domain-containing protein, partial [Frankia gtarii]|uniref:integrase core domain-containing protein n=1 Tax=Frankia gtarii TaxID=2950102 RepID=UPI0021C1C7CC
FDTSTCMPISKDLPSSPQQHGRCRAFHSLPQNLIQFPSGHTNPFSEAQFKTLKYSYDFPDRFGSLADARAYCEGFFTAYNHDHRHSGIGFHTPASVHFGTASQVQAHRQATLDRAHAAHPERFARRPRPPRLPETVWINQPIQANQATTDCRS